MAATNHPELLDPALFRRFDDVIEYGEPTPEIAQRILTRRLAAFNAKEINWEKVISEVKGFSQADLSRIADEAAKRSILAERKTITLADIEAAILDRRHSPKS